MAMLVGLYGGAPVPLRRCDLVLGDVRRPLDLVDDLARQRRLDDGRRQLGRRLHARVGGVHRQVEELVAAFLPDPHAVRDAAKFLAPRPHELAGAIEHDDRVAALAGRVHRVMDVDVALRVLDDVVRVAPLDVGRQLAPVVNRFVAKSPSPSTGAFVPALSWRRAESAEPWSSRADERASVSVNSPCALLGSSREELRGAACPVPSLVT